MIARLGLLLVALPVSAFAYCGNGYPDVSRELGERPLVVVGKVTGLTEWSHDGGVPDGTLYSVEVTEVLKGAAVSRLTLYSENSSGRFPMEIGDSYVIFAYQGTFEFRNSPELAIDNCGNSGSLRDPGAQRALEQVRSVLRYSPTVAGPTAGALDRRDLARERLTPIPSR